MHEGKGQPVHMIHNLTVAHTKLSHASRALSVRTEIFLPTIRSMSSSGGSIVLVSIHASTPSSSGNSPTRKNYDSYCSFLPYFSSDASVYRGEDNMGPSGQKILQYPRPVWVALGLQASGFRGTGHAKVLVPLPENSPKRRLHPPHC